MVDTRTLSVPHYIMCILNALNKSLFPQTRQRIVISIFPEIKDTLSMVDFDLLKSGNARWEMELGQAITILHELGLIANSDKIYWSLTGKGRETAKHSIGVETARSIYKNYLKEHSENTKKYREKYYQKPEVRERMRQYSKRWHQNPDIKERQQDSRYVRGLKLYYENQKDRLMKQKLSLESTLRDLALKKHGNIIRHNRFLLELAHVKDGIEMAQNILENLDAIEDYIKKQNLPVSRAHLIREQLLKNLLTGER